jgi:MFS family permease
VATTSLYWLWVVVLIPTGAGWLAGLTTLSSSVQTLVPGWVRSRAIAVYLLFFYGAMTLGSVVWGIVAQYAGVGPALMASAAWMVIGLLATARYRLPDGTIVSPEHSHHWPDAPPLEHWDSDEGPVLVLVEYQIDPVTGTEFRLAANSLKVLRRRDGAYWWELFEDVEQPGRYVESFLVSSWNDHLRQHDRVLASDRPYEQAVLAFHIGPERPKVTHLIAADARLQTTNVAPAPPT